MSRTSVLGGVASGLCLVLAAGCTFVGEDPEITIDDDTRPRSQLENLDLDAYSSISYEPGTTFSFSLTTVEPPVDGTIVDAWVDVEGEGLRVEGFQVTTEASDNFDVTPGFPPDRRWLKGLQDAKGTPVTVDEAGMQLLVGLTVLDGSYTEVRGLSYVVEDSSGERVTVESPVGLGQCFDDGEGAPECPAGWPAD